MPQPTARDRFIDLLHAAVRDHTLTKLTLGKYRGADDTLRNLFVRPVALKTGLHLAFLWRHATSDITKNHAPDAALATLDSLIGGDFLDAHLFTATQQAQLETSPDGSARLKTKNISSAPVSAPAHDRAKAHPIPANAPWLHALGVTNDRGQPREGMSDKFRQIQKFAELLTHLFAEAGLPADRPLQVVDMGAGKGYLTFAVAALLGDRAHVHGIEQRPNLVDLCNRVARENNFPHLTFSAGQIDSAQIENPKSYRARQGDISQIQNPLEQRPNLVDLCNRVARENNFPHLTFSAGQIDSAQIENPKSYRARQGDISQIQNPLDVLIALHACDTATDDALARGIAAGARLLVVAPCCQKELRSQLTAPPVLAPALRHGIFQERQAEFVTDALRAQLLECAGYRTKVFEFISTEHTAKNLMIAAIKARDAATSPDPVAAEGVRSFAAFYGIRRQRLADHLRIPLLPGT